MSGEALLNGRYRLTSQQGAGGMAVIYKATDEALGRIVAVKVLRPSLTADDTFIVRFKNEARSIANLQHPNIVTVHDVGSEGPTHYIVMEFVEGQDLKRMIRAYGALSVNRALDLGIQICAGLGYAHRAGIVHADVKPQNILLAEGDIVKITDFGIAQALSDTQPAQKQSVVWGSPHYFAPEQAQGEKPSASSDVYSIGIVIFEMLTGRLPYIGANQQELALAHIRERIPSVTEYNPAVPDSLAKIIQKVMSKDPNARYSNADQLGNVLKSYRDRSRQGTLTENPVEATDSRPLSPPPSSLPTQPGQSPMVIPPPPSGSQQSRQVASNIPQGLPTQRYDIAPHAPSAPPSAQRPPLNSDSRAYPPGGSATMRGSTPLQRGDSNPYTPNSPRPPYTSQQFERESSGGLFDAVTIALAVLAFFSVACLCPLWIAVIQARF